MVKQQWEGRARRGRQRAARRECPRRTSSAASRFVDKSRSSVCRLWTPWPCVRCRVMRASCSPSTPGTAGSGSSTCRMMSPGASCQGAGKEHEARGKRESNGAAKGARALALCVQKKKKKTGKGFVPKQPKKTHLTLQRSARVFHRLDGLNAGGRLRAGRRRAGQGRGGPCAAKAKRLTWRDSHCGGCYCLVHGALLRGASRVVWRCVRAFRAMQAARPVIFGSVSQPKEERLPPQRRAPTHHFDLPPKIETHQVDAARRLAPCWRRNLQAPGTAQGRARGRSKGCLGRLLELLPLFCRNAGQRLAKKLAALAQKVLLKAVKC